MGCVFSQQHAELLTKKEGTHPLGEKFSRYLTHGCENFACQCGSLCFSSICLVDICWFILVNPLLSYGKGWFSHHPSSEVFCISQMATTSPTVLGGKVFVCFLNVPFLRFFLEKHIPLRIHGTGIFIYMNG